MQQEFHLQALPVSSIPVLTLRLQCAAPNCQGRGLTSAGRAFVPSGLSTQFILPAIYPIPLDTHCSHYITTAGLLEPPSTSMMMGMIIGLRLSLVASEQAAHIA